MELKAFILFIVLILVLLALDLGLLHRKNERPTAKSSLIWTGFWVGLAMLFGLFVYLAYRHHWLDLGLNPQVSARDAYLEYLSGFLLEKALSLDNIFVMALVFSYFQIPVDLQHRVLFWGILGALVFRALMIAAGAAMLEHFSWTMYVFGALLLISGIRMLISKDDDLDPYKNKVVQVIRKIFPISKRMHGDKFVYRVKGFWAGTPLLLALIVVETTDILFAFDSIPAVFSVTEDSFIVFTSNIFAILGLRSLYFVLASMMGKFKYLKTAMSVLLVVIALKMFVHEWVHVPVWVSLVLIVAILSGGIGLSLWKGGETKKLE